MAPVDAVAKALYEHWAKDQGMLMPGWADADGDDKERWRDFARVAIRTYRTYEKEEEIK